MWGPERQPERKAILWIASIAVAMGWVYLHPKTQAPALEVVTPAGADDLAYNPWGKAPPPPAHAVTQAPRAMTLIRDDSGQFHLTASVNGRDIRFLVDTGADVVALTPQTAQDLGLGVRAEDYQPVLRTASGVGMGARVTLDSLAVPGRRLEHIRAVVAQGLGENLLGLSALRELGRMEMKGTAMTIVPD